MTRSQHFSFTAKLRLLVVIASYGNKNLPFLRRIISNYQKMDFDVHIVVVTEAGKDLGPNIEVVVGLPSRNSWSLPFAHKTVFAERVNQHDLFLYSEDDIDVTEQNLQAFLRVTPHLEPSEVAGFFRYEVDQSGNRSLPDVHGMFHWNPSSVRRRGDFTAAEFTNEHAGFYVLTQAQLRRAITSGEFLREPRDGRYGMLETAATDPFTCCGLRRVICISAFNEFLIHHMANRYVGQLGISVAAFQEQIRTLINIQNGTHPPTMLCDVEPVILQRNWSKSFYEKPSTHLLEMIPADAATVLSIGCGSGELETELLKRGAEVTALPLDSVIGAAAANRGIKVVYGSLRKCLKNFRGKTFDCVVMTNFLHLQKNPGSLIQECSTLLKEGGTLVLGGPNFDVLSVRLKRLFGTGDYPKLQDFGQSGINTSSAFQIKQWMQSAGLKADSPIWFNGSEHGEVSGALGTWKKLRSQTSRYIFRNGNSRFTAEQWIMRGSKHGIPKDGKEAV